MNVIKEPFCSSCRFYRQTSDKKFVCGKFNLEMEPLSRTELKYGCWNEKDNILNIKPNFYGIGFDARAVWKKIVIFLKN